MHDGQRAQDTDGRWFTWKRQAVVFGSGAHSVIWVRVYDE